MPPSKPEWIPKRNGGLEHDGVKIFTKTILVLHLLFCDNFEMRTWQVWGKSATIWAPQN